MPAGTPTVIARRDTAPADERVELERQMRNGRPRASDRISDLPEHSHGFRAFHP
jgi:hypothetical protein